MIAASSRIAVLCHFARQLDFVSRKDAKSRRDAKMIKLIFTGDHE
jgi:hypothetical protein